MNRYFSSSRFHSIVMNGISRLLSVVIHQNFIVHKIIDVNNPPMATFLQPDSVTRWLDYVFNFVHLQK